MTLSTTSPGDERAEYEQWLRSQHKARFWNTSDAMFAAWQAGRASSSPVQQVGADALDAADEEWRDIADVQQPSDEQALLGWTRYEKARKLNPAQWAELHQRNLRGENFDDMIDALPAATQPAQQDTSHLPRFVVNGVYQNGRHFSRRFDSAADRDDWLEAEGFENMAEFKCSEEPQ